MENPKLGKWLIIIGILIALIPLFTLSGIIYYFTHTVGIIETYAPWIFFIIGISIAIFGEYLSRK